MPSSADHFTGDAADAIQKATSDPNLFHFKELLDLDAVQQLGSSDPSFEILELFCYKTYADYTQRADALKLNDAQLEKLRLLTLVSQCADQKIVSYSALKEALDISCVRELEDLVISAIEAGLLKGKMFHREQHFKTSFAAGRDVHPDEYGNLLSKLVAWKAHSETIIAQMDAEVEEGSKQHTENRAAAAAKDEALSKQRTEVMDKLKNQKDSQGGFNMTGFSSGRHRNRGRSGIRR